MIKSIADIRKDYTLQTLNEADVSVNPFQQFETWWNEALASNIDEVNAMTLSTINQLNKPTSRTVLLKGFDQDGFSFFTNYNSAKGRDINFNHNVSLCFFWKELQRQIRIEGIATKLSDQENDEYFNSRPIGSRIGAWASPQSQVIKSRSILEENEKKLQQEFGNDIKRPSHWGGYKVIPNYFEFWQGRASRLHDRISFSLENDHWKIQRLAP
jgi:pyridoxamine 5'-phosphate oxidase